MAIHSLEWSYMLEQGLCNEKAETLLIDTKENLEKWKDHVFWPGRLNTVKLSILPKYISKFNVIPIKYQQFFLTQTSWILKFMWKKMKK